MQRGVYKITEIGSGSYLIDERTSTMFVLVGSESALVIDCGTGIGDFKSVVEELVCGKPYKVIATHSHVDHIGGRGQFGDIYLSETDAPFIKSVTTAYRRAYTVANSAFTGNIKGKKFAPVKVEPKVHFVCEGDEFDLGGRVIRVCLTPGHTVGSISLLDVTNRTIYVGDVANDFTFMWLPHSTTVDTMIATLKKLIALDGYDTVWASHHTVSFTRDDIREFLAGAQHLAKRKNSVLPLVLVSKYKNNRIFYRATHIH